MKRPDLQQPENDDWDIQRRGVYDSYGRDSHRYLT
jgi:hypothetical protein